MLLITLLAIRFLLAVVPVLPDGEEAVLFDGDEAVGGGAALSDAPNQVGG